MLLTIVLDLYYMIQPYVSSWTCYGHIKILWHIQQSFSLLVTGRCMSLCYSVTYGDLLTFTSWLHFLRWPMYSVPYMASAQICSCPSPTVNSQLWPSYCILFNVCMTQSFPVTVYFYDCEGPRYTAHGPGWPSWDHICMYTISRNIS